jgi:heterodisulfide reductase subunit A
MEPGKGTKSIAGICGLEPGKDGFLKTSDMHFGNNKTDKKGIFLAGSCICPMSINDTISNARSAALEVHNYLQSK